MVLGAAIGSGVVMRGLGQLAVAPRRLTTEVAAVAVGLGGVVAVLAAREVGSWWLLPALLVWAYGLAAAATCDAMTQRVPTPLVKQTVIVTAVLVITAAATTGTWRWAAFAAISGTVAAAIFAFCWRFLGAGFGDVRLAVLGGIGLTEPTRIGIIAAFAAFIVITLGQAVVVLARGGNRYTRFAYGPAIAASFVVAAII